MATVLTEAEEMTLEGLIDSHGLAVVVDAVARVCALKADHIDENWQDEVSAEIWRRAARTISKTALSPHLDGL